MLKLKNVALLLLVLVLGFLSIGSATEPLQFKLPWVTLVLPFQDVYGEYLFDIKRQTNLLGLATPIITGNAGKNRLSIGGAKEEGNDNIVSYLGFDSAVSDKYFTERANIGVWIGADFGLPGDLKDKLRGGIKGSLKFW